MKYTVIGKSVEITSGVLTLSATQSADRAHLLKHVKGSQYEVLRTVTFKKGEQFGYDGVLPKSIAENLESEKSSKADKAAADKAAADKAGDNAGSSGNQ